MFKKYAVKALDAVINKLDNRKIRRRGGSRRRGFQAAEIGRLTNDWPLSSKSPNDEIYTALSRVRARARHLKQNHEYAARYLKLMTANVVGRAGINLQVRAKNAVDGKDDDFANRTIETAWKDWGKKGVCTVDGELSFVDVQKMIIESVHCAGEILVRKITGFDNGFGFALRMYEADHLDDEFNATLPNGNNVVMGVERDAYNRVVAYWLLTNHPGAWLYKSISNEHERVPADEMMLLGIPDRPGQARFISPMVNGMYRAQMLHGYEEAELVAARTASSKMGFFISEDGKSFTGDDIDGDEDDHDVITEAEPGTFDQLPVGVDFKPWDPQHPTTAYDPFVKSSLRALASAWNVSYVSLANDLTGVSYSSIRQGALDERDHYRCTQKWLIDHFLTNCYESWLKQFLTLPSTTLPPTKYNKFNSPVWGPRGWAWVDPQKEVAANISAVENGMKNLSDIAAEQGRDFEEVLQTRKSDIELMEKYGVSLSILAPPPEGETDADNN